MNHYTTYTTDGTTAIQVSNTAVRVRGNVYDFQRPVTVALVKALVKTLNKAGV